MLEAEEEAPAELMVEEKTSEELETTDETTEESDRSGLAGAVLLGMAAAAAHEEEEPIAQESAPLVEEASAAEVTVEEHEGVEEGEVPELPDWLADLEEGTRSATDQSWTPDQAAMTKPLEKFDVNVPGEIPEIEYPAE
jgi:hypothetical protein